MGEELSAVSQTRQTIWPGEVNRLIARHDEGNPVGCPYRSNDEASGLVVGGLFTAKIAPLTISLERQNQASPVVPIKRRNNRSPAARAEVGSAR